MTLKLIRSQFRSDGIFSALYAEDGSLIARTLEHSYDGAPKLYNGTFTCMRGTHELHNLRPFETFEITGVAGHTGILFHVGNWNADSDGCVLLGEVIVDSPEGRMLTGSRVAFNAFMDSMIGVDTFELVVS